jgi:hypothetical protein
MLDEEELNRPQQQPKTSIILPVAVAAASNDDEQLPTATVVETRTVNIMYGLSGNAQGFLQEFSVSLKSVLLNAPLSDNLMIHILADKPAYNSLGKLFNKTGIATWQTRHAITIQTYNIQPNIQPWLQTIQKRMNLSREDATKGHTVGTWFRLFAHEIIALPSNNTSVLYIDSDAVVMANMDSLFAQYQELQHEVSFQWGATKCAGFIFLNLAKLNRVWDLVSHTNWTQASEAGENRINDQLIFVEINRTHPEEVALLPLEWDVHYSNGELWKTSLLHARPNGVGMLHLNGGGNSQKNAFTTHFEIFDNATLKLHVVKDWRIVKIWNGRGPN